MPTLGYEFSDPRLLELAMTHSSMRASADNERLEFLGDAALDLIVAEDLFKHHTGSAEGVLTDLKARVVSRVTLAEAALALGLEAHARLGTGLTGRVLSRSVLANLYEALLGAIYLDGGLEAAREFALASLREPLSSVRDRRPRAVPKQALQEVAQTRWGQPPSYTLIETRGEAHARAFLVAAEAGGRRFPSAWGRTRKEAEGWAAYEALLLLEPRPGEPSA